MPFDFDDKYTTQFFAINYHCLVAFDLFYKALHEGDVYTFYTANWYSLSESIAGKWMNEFMKCIDPSFVKPDDYQMKPIICTGFCSLMSQERDGDCSISRSRPREAQYCRIKF